MRAITAAILGFGFLLATEANSTDAHCVRPEQPPGTGNSMLTWRMALLYLLAYGAAVYYRI
jgi:hypothetical protein